jgi:Carbohydrate binding domain
MVALTRRAQDVLTVALAAAAIGGMSVGWAATAPGDEAPANDEARGSDEAPAGEDTPSAEDTGPSPEPTPTEAVPEPPRRNRERPSFAEDFEQGLDRWSVVGSAAVTDETSSHGQRSVTLTSTACRGDAYSRPIQVEAGSTYRFSTEYRTDGGGGYVGLDLYDAAGGEIDEEWLIGDGGFPTYQDVRWRYNVDERDPDDLRVWGHYTASYQVPEPVASVQIKIEDWGCGGLPDDPAGAPVYFDRIRWTLVPDRP